MATQPLATDSSGNPIYGFGGDPTLGAAQYNSQGITLDSLKPVTPVTIPTPTPTSNGADLMAGVNAGTKTLNDYIAANTASSENTPYGNKAGTLYDRLGTLLPELAGMNQYQADQEAAAGVPKYTQAIQEANSNTITANAEYEVLKAEAQARKDALEAGAGQAGLTTGLLGGQQAAVDRQYNSQMTLKATEAALSYAKAQAAAGNLTVAQGIVNKAVDAKYKDRIQEKQDILDQLQAISPFLTAEQAKIKDAVTQKTADDKQALEDKKAQAKTNISTALESGITSRYANKNGEIFDVNSGVAYSTPADFFKAAGVTSFDQAYQQGLVTDLNNAKMQDINTIKQIISKYPDAGVRVTDTLEQAKAKLASSPTYRKDTYIAPKAGTDNTPALSSKDLAVRSIIASNPGEWGKAADAIDAKYGKGTSSQYDSLLKAVYQDGQSIDELAPLNDIQSIASGIINGNQPPVLTGLYSKSAAVKAELERQGFDLSKAYQQWTATNKFLASANSTTQLRMRQAEASVENSLANLQSVSDAMNRTGFKFANKAELSAARNGAMGSEAAQQAQALEGQVALITDELGQTFMGGNSPTDAAFGLAAKVLQGDFSKSVMDNQIKLIQQNLQYRKNSWNQAGVVEAGSDNPYTPSSGGSLEEQVKSKGYDYQQMKNDGNSDEEIKQALGL